MAPAPLPEDEEARLVVLRRYQLEQIKREDNFNRLTEVVARVMDVPTALVTLIDASDQCFAGSTGFDGPRTARSVAFCAHTILSDTPNIVTDATRDPRFSSNPLVLESPFIRFYAGIPLKIEGQRLGSLCIIDTKPRDITRHQIETLIGFARVVEDTIHLRLARIQNEENQRRIAGYLDATPVALAIYDEQDRLVSVNMKYKETFFADPETNLQPGLSFPQVLDRVSESGRTIKVKGDATDWRQRRIDLRKMDASPYEMQVDDVWLVCNETRTSNGELLAAFTDLTDMKRRASEAATQATLLRTTLENLDQGIALFCPKGRLLAYSEAYFDLLSFPQHLREEGVQIKALLKSLRARGFLRQDDSTAVANDIAEAKGGRRIRRMNLHSPDGRAISMTNTVLEDGRVIVTCTDVTELREIERMKNEFVSTVSHELRTPLTSITGSLGLLIGGTAGEMPPKMDKLVRIAHRNADRLTRLVNDLLDIDKVETGQMQFDLQRLDLNVLVEQAVEQNQPYAERVGVVLRAAPAPEPVFVKGDMNRLLQVAANLISNAVKFSPAGEEVTVCARLDADRACLAVTDRGPGIPDKFRSQLFERFSQAETSDQRSQQGTGLGLAIALAIIERHGGLISVETGEGQGTRFEVVLPVFAQVPAPAASQVSRHVATTQPLVLICHRDEATGLQVKQMLKLAGTAAEHVTTTQIALQLLNERRYEALVLDLDMPHGAAIDLIRSVRSDPRISDIRIIMTAVDAQNTRHEVGAIGLDVFDWIESPVNLPRLAAALARSRQDKDRMLSILHVEDAADLGQVVRIALAEVAKVDLVQDLQTARTRLAVGCYDAVILDIRLPDGSGLDLLKDLALLDGPCIPVVIYAGEEASDEISSAVYQALTKSRTSIDQLVDVVRKISPRCT